MGHQVAEAGLDSQNLVVPNYRGENEIQTYSPMSPDEQ
jgi:hypothetical protein